MKIYRNIVFAVNFTEGSRIACARAAALADCFGSQLTLLHVIEHFPQDRSNDVIAPEDVNPGDYRQTEAHQNLAELAAIAGCNEAAREVRFSRRAAWHEIVDFARALKADLVILAGHVRHGPAVLQGSTAANVVSHCHCDVLIAHEQ